MLLMPLMTKAGITVDLCTRSAVTTGGFNGIRTHDLRDTGAMLYRLRHEASLEAGQVRAQFIPVV